MDTQIWQHVTSGERYAVAVNQAGAVIAAAGPLHHSEISVALAGDWDGDPEVAADIQADTASYRDVTEAPRYDAPLVSAKSIARALWLEL